MDTTPSQLRFRALAGTAAFLITIALLILVPAGSLAYWQAWLFLLVLSLSILVITLYFLRYDPALMARRVRAGPRAETEPGQRVIQTFTSVSLILVFIVSGLDHRFGWSEILVMLVLIADVGAAIGFLIVFLTFRANSHASATIEVTADQTVVSTGPYGVVRHPMYAGTSLFILSTPIALGSGWGLLFVIPTIGGIVWRLIEEEKFLLERLSGYRAYRATVRFRLVPFVW